MTTLPPLGQLIAVVLMGVIAAVALVYCFETIIKIMKGDE
jgi:hypothetical protein